MATPEGMRQRSRTIECMPTPEAMQPVVGRESELTLLKSIQALATEALTEARAANATSSELRDALLGSKLNPKGGRLVTLEKEVEGHLSYHQSMDKDVRQMARETAVELKETAVDTAKTLAGNVLTRRQLLMAKISIAVVGTGVIATIIFNFLSVLHVIHP